MATNSQFDSLPNKNLDVKAEQLLAERIQKTPTPELINELVMDNLREAIVYTRKVSHNQIKDDELMSICYAALVRNAKRFKPGFGVRFFGFAKAGLRGELCRYWKGQDTVRNSSINAVDEPIAEPSSVEEETVEPEFDAIFTREQFSIVQSVISEKCSEQEQMVLELAYQGRMNFQRIGKILGVSRSAVQATHARALKKVRDTIARRERLLESENSRD